MMLEVVTFYLVGIGLYHLFIGPLPLAERISGRNLQALFTTWLYTPSKPAHP